MRRFLLDVSVLVALVDPLHLEHQRAHAWLGQVASQGWATCPITENGLIRILGNPRYTNSPGSPAVAAALIIGLRSGRNHQFWPDDISLLDHQSIDPARLLASSQITDTYLLALAVAHNGELVTFDSRLVADAVVGGRKALHLIV